MEFYPYPPRFSVSSLPCCRNFFEKVKEACNFALSAVIGNVFSAILTFFFALVGTLLGAMTGALIGQETESGFVRGAAVGAISGAVFSIEVFESSLVLWQSDESGIGCILYLGSTKGLPGDSVEKIPKIKITNKNNVDASGDRVSCSVCLQDFQLGETVRSLPQCHHMFHLPCIDKWLLRHASCPLCRRDL
ncbi:NEP1-interacting protein 1 [Linum perenne]